MIQIKHKITGQIFFTVEADTLRGAYLEGAYLRNANLQDAYLRNANLQDAYLRNANLQGANLEGAYLEGAYLEGAYLEGAYLRNANLQGANLEGAYLEGAYLRNANLTHANLEGANLTGVANSLGIELDPSLPARIVAQVEANPESHDQTIWHSDCGTEHCVAGWATTLSGPLGKYLDINLGTSTAATLLLWRPGVEMPSFKPTATTEETIGRLRKMAETADKA